MIFFYFFLIFLATARIFILTSSWISHPWLTRRAEAHLTSCACVIAVRNGSCLHARSIEILTRPQLIVWGVLYRRYRKWPVYYTWHWRKLAGAGEGVHVGYGFSRHIHRCIFVRNKMASSSWLEVHVGAPVIMNSASFRCSSPSSR